MPKGVGYSKPLGTRIKEAKQRNKKLRRKTEFDIETRSGTKKEIKTLRKSNMDSLKLAIKSRLKKNKQKKISKQILKESLKRGIKRMKKGQK